MEEIVCIFAGLAVALSVVGLLRVRDANRRQLRFEANRLVDEIYREFQRPAQRDPAMPWHVSARPQAEARPPEVETEFTRLATNIELQRTAELERRIGALQSLRRRLRHLHEGMDPGREAEAPGVHDRRPSMQTLH